MLYYLKQEVIGNECSKVFDGVEARYTMLRLFPLFSLIVNKVVSHNSLIELT